VTESAARTVSPGIEAFSQGGERGLVVAVDGPAGSGKSTVARRVALDLGLRYLDTGAMYRALTWWMLGQGIDASDASAVLARLGEPRITVVPDASAPRIYVDGLDVAVPIRTRTVSNAVSLVAALPPVREKLIAMQRRIIADAADTAGIVAEGRDIGTVVAPDAAVKVYLTASEETRAERRSADLAGDPAATVDATRHEQATRDRLDAAQMVMAADAVHIDTTGLEIDEVVGRIVGLVIARQAMSGG
jgi:cytidylate kinase